MAALYRPVRGVATSIAFAALAVLSFVACSAESENHAGGEGAARDQDASALPQDADVGAALDATLADAPADATVADDGAGTASRDASADRAADADGNAPLDVTFYVVADTHADPEESYDLRAMARTINVVSRGGVWPSMLDGMPTRFVGGAVAPPRGVVLVGDITGWGTAPTELLTFRRYFEKGFGPESIEYPAYIGLGNHDVDDADRNPALGALYRGMYYNQVESRHRGATAPVPVTSFDDASRNYSWDFDRVHLVQTHRFPGDKGYGLASSVSFVANDLKRYASDGRPVFVFHHYGMDAFGTEDRWWTAADRTTYRGILTGFDVAGIFAGHSHYPMQYSWEGLRVFQVNNAKAEIDAGNRDGNGSFAIVRITDTRLDVVTCRWLDDRGRYELVAPYFSGPSSAGRAL